jgi:hypothetical protein
VLATVEREELLSAKLQGYRDVKDVQGAGADPVGVAFGELDGALVGGSGNGIANKHTSFDVGLQSAERGSYLRRRIFSSKYTRLKRSDELQFAE